MSFGIKVYTEKINKLNETVEQREEKQPEKQNDDTSVFTLRWRERGRGR